MSCTDEPLNPGTRRAANIRPYEVVLPIQRTLNKDHVRQALFSQAYGLPASPKGSFWWELLAAAIQRTALFRHVAGRQIADPYELREFYMSPFNLPLSKPLGGGRLVSAPTDHSTQYTNQLERSHLYGD